MAKYGVDPATIFSPGTSQNSDSSATPAQAPVASPASSGGLSRQDYMAKYGVDPATFFAPPAAASSMTDNATEQIPGTAPTTVNAPTPLITALQNTGPSQMVKKGQGHGAAIVDPTTGQVTGHKRTIGDIYGNVSNTLGDIGVGIDKAIVRTPVSLAQALTPDAAFGSDSLLNSGSAKAQAFKQATTGQGGFQKAGATAADIGSLALGGEGAGELAAEGTKLIPGLGDIASEVGTAGKVARAAPKLASGLANNVVADAILSKGQPYQNVGQGIGSAAKAAGVQLLFGALGEGLNALKYSGAAGKAQELADAAKNASKFAGSIVDEVDPATGEVTKKADPFAVGAHAQAKADFKSGLTKFVQSSKDQKIFDIANQKIANAAGGAADAATPAVEQSFGSMTPNDIHNVANVIFDNAGGIGKLANGKADTLGLAAKMGQKASGYAQQLQDLLKSEGSTRNVQEVKDAVISKLKEGKNETQKGIIDREAEKYFNAINPNSKNELETGNFFGANTTAKNDIPKWDTAVGNETQKARQQIALETQNQLLKNSNNPSLAKKLLAEQTKLYNARNVLAAIDGNKVPSLANKGLVQTLSTIGGIMSGHPAGGYVLGQVANKLNDMGGELAASDVTRGKFAPTFAQAINAKNENALQDEIKTGIAKNKLATDLKPYQTPALPAPAEGTPANYSANNVPINLPAETPSTVAARETGNIQNKIQGRNAIRQSIGDVYNPKPLLSAATSSSPLSYISDGTVINLPARAPTTAEREEIANIQSQIKARQAAGVTTSTATKSAAPSISQYVGNTMDRLKSVSKLSKEIDFTPGNVLQLRGRPDSGLQVIEDLGNSVKTYDLQRGTVSTIPKGLLQELPGETAEPYLSPSEMKSFQVGTVPKKVDNLPILDYDTRSYRKNSIKNFSSK